MPTYKLYTYTADHEEAEPPLQEGGFLPRIEAPNIREAVKKAYAYIEAHEANHQVAEFDVVEADVYDRRPDEVFIDRPHTEFCDWDASHEAPEGCNWTGDEGNRRGPYGLCGECGDPATDVGNDFYPTCGKTHEEDE